MAPESNAYVLHSGVGVRHATQGKGAELYHQYVVVDQRWGFQRSQQNAVICQL
jgi:hypothetical protein